MRLKDYFTVYAGGDLQKDCFSPNKTDINKYPIFSNSLENYGLFGYTSKPNYIKNSLTITGRGNVGHSFYRAEDFDAIIRLLVLEPKKNVNSKYFNYLINYSVAFPIESTGVPQLTRPQVENTEVNVIHNSTQQDYIINIMESVDNLIDSLKKQKEKVHCILLGTINTLFKKEDKMDSLSDYVNVQNGFAFSSSLFTSIGNKIIRIGDIKDGTVEMDKCVSYPTNIVLDNSFKITKGNLLLAMSGATTGKVGLYKSELVAYNNQRVAKIEPKNSNDDNFKYMYFYFLSDLYKNELAEVLTAGAQPNISASQIKKLKINNFKKDEETYYLLKDLNEKETKLNCEIRKYENIRDGLMNGIFAGRIDIPENYEEV